MLNSWYVLYIRGLGKDGVPLELPQFPNVGSRIVHFLGRSTDEARMAKDKKNGLWSKIQDGVRPAWAPDFLRLGYCVVFNRTGFPKLALDLGLKNPKKLRSEQGGYLRRGPNGKRILTFDDVWVVGVDIERRPLLMPTMKLGDQDWWLYMLSEQARPTHAYIVPGGGRVVSGVQRLADIVSQMLATPNGYPRKMMPREEEVADDYSEFLNPLTPISLMPRTNGTDSPRSPTDTSPGGYAGTEVFRS